MVNGLIEIFDRALWLQRLQRAAPHYQNHDFLLRWCEEQLCDRLSLVTKEFENVLVIGERVTPFLRDHLQSKTVTHLRQSDIFPAHFDNNAIGSPEALPFKPHSFDLIISALELHLINDLPGTLLQIKNTLKSNGLFIGAMFGGETLSQLRQSMMQTEMDLKGGVSPRVFPFADKQDMGALLQRAGFALPVVDSDQLTVTYENMFKLMAELRAMGESNIIKERDKKNPGKNFFLQVAHYYQHHFAEEDGRIPATFEIIFLHGWAPHESQQKPLMPGSAEKSLKDFL
ncbi:MAG: class I SAM-dependent methyltransferase [Alphaproteobacteria bacterium]